MSLPQTEFETLIHDASKRIDGDIVWVEDEDHSPSREFRAEIGSDAGWPLFLKGSYNPLLPALTYAVIHRAAGRIYVLDLGKDHRNPQNTQLGEKHKHRWSEQFRDKEAYVPPDITHPANDPVAVWEQFCMEAKIAHHGTMQSPPPFSGDLFL